MSNDKLKYCFGIDFGTTNSATVGYAFMGGGHMKKYYMVMMNKDLYHL